MTYEEIKSMLKQRVSLIVDASEFDKDQLQDMAIAAFEGAEPKATLTLRRLENLPFDVVENIGLKGQGQVVLDLTE